MASVTLPSLRILNLDINGTVIAGDEQGGKDIEDTLQDFLARATVAKWDENSPECSYREYVWNHLLPGAFNDKALKHERKKKICSFVTHLQETKHPFAERVAKQFEEMKELVSPEQPYFPSFIELITKSDPETTRFIFRSFGNEHHKVKAAFQKYAPGVSFREGKYVEKDIPNTQQKEIVFEYKGKDGGPKEVSSPAKLYRKFTKHHWMITDHYPSWNQHNEIGRYGKPFYYDPQCADALSYFFDDNADRTENPDQGRTIVNPIALKAHGPESVSVAEASNFVLKVDSVRAILDKNYFLDRLA